nr:hypothetical protein [uncultured Albidiferax sp.]
MNIATLRKKAHDGSLEVEHLLQAAAKRPLGLSDELARLTSEYQWQVQGLQPDGTRVVPFAKWAAVAAAYSDEEFDGLRTLAKEPENVPFVLGLVEELHTSASVSFALELCNKYLAHPAQSHNAAFSLARTFNLLLSFKQAPPVTAAQARSVQDFLFALYPHSEREADRALVLLALRGVGDHDAVPFVESTAAFAEPWSGTKEAVLRAVRKRLKAHAL